MDQLEKLHERCYVCRFRVFGWFVRFHALRCAACVVIKLDHNSHKTKEDKNALIKPPNDMSLPQHKQKRNKHLLDRIAHAGPVVPWIPRERLDALEGGAGEVDEVEG